jgi:pilus assembly protein CpaB
MENRRPNSPLVKGMPILESMLVDPNNRNGAADRIPMGYRALPVKVTSDMTSGLVQPGDMVDVLVVLRQSGAITKTIAKTILQNVRVFAINEHIVRDVNADGAVIEAKTVTLQVTPHQVEVLTLASRMGDLSLSIRPPADPMMVENEGLDLEGLLDSSEVSEKVDAERERKEKSGDGGFADFVRSQGQSRLADMAAALPVERGPTMVILEPEGERWYQFGPNGDRPQQVTPCDTPAAGMQPTAAMDGGMVGGEVDESIDAGGDDEQPVDDGDNPLDNFSLDKIGL